MRSQKSFSAAKPTFVIHNALLASAIVPTQAQTEVQGAAHVSRQGRRSPELALVRDASGNLYGTTVGGTGKRSKYGCGTAFKLDKSGKQVWLCSFQGEGGRAPDSSLLRDAAGSLYGTERAAAVCDVEGQAAVSSLDWQHGKEGNRAVQVRRHRRKRSWRTFS